MWFDDNAFLSSCPIDRRPNRPIDRTRLVIVTPVGSLRGRHFGRGQQPFVDFIAASSAEGHDASAPRCLRVAFKAATNGKRIPRTVPWFEKWFSGWPCLLIYIFSKEVRS